MWKSLRVYLVGVKTKGIENERERMGKMRVWLGVERGRENGAVQQFSFQAHQNLIFLGKKTWGKMGSWVFGRNCPSNVQIFIKSFFFLYFSSLLFHLFIIYHFFFLFLCAHPFFFLYFLILSFFSFFLFFFGAHPFFSQQFFFLEKKVSGSLNFLCYFFIYFLFITEYYLFKMKCSFIHNFLIEI